LQELFLQGFKNDGTLRLDDLELS